MNFPNVAISDDDTTLYFDCDQAAGWVGVWTSIDLDTLWIGTKKWFLLKILKELNLFYLIVQISKFMRLAKVKIIYQV